ncbi:GNAT family N-acetyltransferase [Loktanella sp. Alg231-35]|uniref:GNAT family N-acetyltransferase n=1 Tax=Loktanella sp. Alg231-35 TaxID=1922220 RepID=UPI000D556490|nr:GNAT family N-acetyltransferase [Loktanella sp. Alg231-35]
MIRATRADRAAIETFMLNHIATSMFPLSNLRRHGMEGGHARAMKFWLRWKGGALTDVLPITEEGMVFPQCPTAPWGEVKTVLTGQVIKGLLGDGAQVAALRAALGLSDAGGMDASEPLYRLDLSNLQMPDCAGLTLRPLSDAPRALINRWRSAYLSEVLPMPGQDPDVQAVHDVNSYLEADSHRVLYQGDTPVAMTGFNAILPQAVQIGGVYTPPGSRSQGLARRAVALHLAEARTKGADKAILFASSPQASKAYEAIGFQRGGDFTTLVYEHPQVIYG